MLKFIVVVLLLGSHAASSRTWSEEKCQRYGNAWTQAERHQGTEGLSASFLAAHGTFLASGCQDRAVCPRSRAEVAMADLMTVLALNAGMSGTFLPFICRS